jgi:hypothetical protein
MGYDNKPVNRSDKAGERMTRHESKDKELDAAKKSGNYGVRTDAFAEGDGYVGVDDLDRLRRDKLKHQTK